MIIRNGRVYTDQFVFQKQDVYIENGIIAESEEQVSDKTVIDAEGLTVLPGLVDVHTHGALGHAFCHGDAEGLRKVAAFMRASGTTSFCPTSSNVSIETLERSFRSAAEVAESPGEEGARILGINMEGPFISNGKKGAQNGDYTREPDYKLFHELNQLSGNRIKLVTLAPEVDGGMEFIDQAKDEVNIAIGHTTASYETAAEAFRRGACQVTHLFNAMPPLAHREPGVIGAAFDSPHCMAELICDGVHIHPCVLRAAFRMFTDDRIVMITDSHEVCGLEDGVYQEISGLPIIKKGGRVTLPDGTIAGSNVMLLECVQRAISFGIPEESVIKAATANPAKSIGEYHRCGSITAGKYADLLLVNDKYELIRVL